tara:strand:+ start:45 stop:1037 length:993 start_codon:yes stop_codon:yes gene_type:complete
VKNAYVPSPPLIIKLMKTFYAILIYPLVIDSSFFLLEKIHNFFTNDSYIYKDGECLLKMVNVSNPEHFARHPLWPHRGYTTDCNVNLYFEVQQSNRVEFILTRLWYVGSAIVGIFVLLRSKPKHTLSYVPLAIMAIAMAFITYHYQHDNTFFSVSHHTMLENSLFSAGNSTPHGFLNTQILAQFFVIILVKNILVKSNKLNWCSFVKVYIPLHSWWLIWIMLVVHPHVHEHNKSFYPWPLNHVFKDFDGHVLIHHVSGYCLGSIPHTGYFHDMLLFLHGKLFEHNIVERLTVWEKILNYTVTVILGFVAWTYLYVTYRVSVCEPSKTKNA